MTRLLWFVGLCAMVWSGCVTPLARSYDDPYNSPTPDETAPPSLSVNEEACHRDPHGCEEVCVSDSDCEDGERCVRAQCLPEKLQKPKVHAPAPLF